MGFERVRRRLLQQVMRPRPLLRGALEFVNAANGLHPLGGRGYGTVPTFAFGWPTSELPTLYLGASALDAVRRGRRGHFARPPRRGRSWR
jgi:hypothetical protein